LRFSRCEFVRSVSNASLGTHAVLRHEDALDLVDQARLVNASDS